MNGAVVISGYSSSGKSTLLAELGRRGYAIVEEPGRRTVKEELKAGVLCFGGPTKLPLNAALSRWLSPIALQRLAAVSRLRDVSPAPSAGTR